MRTYLRTVTRLGIEQICVLPPNKVARTLIVP